MIKTKLLFVAITIISSCSKPHNPIKNLNQKPLIVIHTTGNTGGIHAVSGRKVSKEFGINAIYISHGCMVDKELQNRISKQKIKNQKSYKYYEKELGKSWKKEFDLAVIEEMKAVAKRSFKKRK